VSLIVSVLLVNDALTTPEPRTITRNDFKDYRLTLQITTSLFSMLCPRSYAEKACDNLWDQLTILEVALGNCKRRGTGQGITDGI